MTASADASTEFDFGRHRPPARDLARIAPGVVVLLLIVAAPNVSSLSLELVCQLCVGLAAVALWTQCRFARRGAWSAGTALLVIFACFHFGLAILSAIRQPIPDFMSGYVLSWFNQYSSAREALVMSLIAMWTFVAGYVFVGHRTVISVGASRTADGTERRIATYLGAGLVVVGVTVILGFVAITAPALLLGAGGRSAYWTEVEGTPIQAFSIPMITLGSLLLGVGRPGWLRTIGFAALAIFGVWALSVGARTHIMYAAAALLVVLARRRKMPSARSALLALFATLALVGFIGQARLGGELSQRADLNPAVGLAEMGGSIRPVIEVIEYRRVNHEPLMLGATYAAFVSRATESLLALDRPDGLIDPRIAGNEFRGRLDGFQIGYSAVAEAFRNGDLVGVVVVFLAFGCALGALDNRRTTRGYDVYAMGLVFYVLAFHVRQPSIAMATTLLLGLLLLGVWKLLANEEQHGAKSTPGSLPDG